MKDSKNAMRVVEVSMQEIWHHTRPSVHGSKKKYTRKKKHKACEE